MPRTSFPSRPLIMVLTPLAAAIGLSVTAAHSVPPLLAQERPPAPIEDLNNATRMLYTLAKQDALARAGPVMIVAGDDLVLRHGSKRLTARIIPDLYHTLKTFDHIPLAIDVTLAAHAGENPLAEDVVHELDDYRKRFTAAAERIDTIGLDNEQRERQRTIVAACGAFLDGVLKNRRCTAAERVAFTRRMTPLLLGNVAAAARAELDTLHHQVQEWKRLLTTEEWNQLTILVIGRQMPRRDNLAVQYFARLLGQAGEGRRIIYAEGLGEEPRALDLLATHLVDGQVGSDFFDDPLRMSRDLLSEVASDYLPLLLDIPGPAPSSSR